LFIFIYFGFKLFINSAIYDFKDVRGDALAGIKTLPVSLGVKKTRYVLLAMQTVSHLVLLGAVTQGYIAFEPVILFYSFIAGAVCIMFYTIPQEMETKEKKMVRTFLVDGESTSIMGLRAFAGPFILSCLSMLSF
jgi:4-hydroxybenzoate polyprenyltransferase